MQDHQTLNGSTALVLHTLGEIRADVRTISHEVRETRAGMQGLTRRLDLLERPSLRDRFLDASGWLTGAVILVLAVAGKWTELGAFLGASGK